MKKFFLPVMGIVLLAACTNHASHENQESSVKAAPDSSMAKTDSSVYTASMIDNVKDPVCGMPTTAEISDTAHYNKKVIGFCSKECKDEFLKDVKKNFATVEWKK